MLHTSGSALLFIVFVFWVKLNFFQMCVGLGKNNSV